MSAQTSLITLMSFRWNLIISVVNELSCLKHYKLYSYHVVTCSVNVAIATVLLSSSYWVSINLLSINCMYVCTCTCLYVCTYMHSTCRYMYVIYMYVCMYACLVHTYVCMYVCMSVYVNKMSPYK